MVKAGRAGRRRDQRADPAARRRRHRHRRRQLALRRHAAGGRRSARTRGLRFIGTGVSGGEEGALLGPSIMPGGDREAYGTSSRSSRRSRPRSTATPCCAYIGPDGAGHYVKMVHNGIEYADMQLIAEAYDLLRHGVGLDVPPNSRKIFDEWNTGDLESFLIEITADGARQDRRRDRAAARRRDRRRRPSRRAPAGGPRRTRSISACRSPASPRPSSRARLSAVRTSGAAPQRAGRPDAGRRSRRRSSTTSARRSTRPRSSPTPRASS